MRMNNANFRTALAWVARHRPRLFDERIRGHVFTQDDGPGYPADGWFWEPKRPGLEPEVVIVDRPHSVERFVEILTHELTHFAQYLRGEKPTEPEALSAGREAGQQYRRAAADAADAEAACRLARRQTVAANARLMAPQYYN